MRNNKDFNKSHLENMDIATNIIVGKISEDVSLYLNTELPKKDFFERTGESLSSWRTELLDQLFESVRTGIDEKVEKDISDD